MRCPKCGSSLKEEEYAGIVLVDRCSSKDCGGSVFFDEGELEILMKAKTPLPQRYLQALTFCNGLWRWSMGRKSRFDIPAIIRLPLQNNFPKRNLISITRH